MPGAVRTPSTLNTTSGLAELSEPGPIEHTVFVSAYWAAKASGLVNFDNPGAAELEDHDVRIALPVHVLTHPTHGTVLIDTGVPWELQAKGLPAKLATRPMELVKPLGDIVDEVDSLSAVFLTHMHVDHILGLPDVPVGTPLYVGPDEWSARGGGLGLLHRSINASFGEHAFSELEFSGPVDGFDGAFDVWGDGTLWVLYTPGHTPGSISLVARTTEGGMLFTGDTCHTLWGWEHGVEPGGFTEDHASNLRNLGLLKELAEEHELTVWVGHETDGDGTGIVE